MGFWSFDEMSLKVALIVCLGEIMSLKSVELLITIALKAFTWRASCRCLTTDSLPWGYSGQLFGLRCVLELDGECKDSRFILVRAPDR
jgi:hypothetical protein